MQRRRNHWTWTGGIAGASLWQSHGQSLARYAERMQIMAVDVSDWIALTALVTSFLAYLEAKKATKTSDAIEALTLVIDASEKTQTYLDKRADGAERDKRTEYGLAEDWRALKKRARERIFLILRVGWPAIPQVTRSR